MQTASQPPSNQSPPDLKGHFSTPQGKIPKQFTFLVNKTSGRHGGAQYKDEQGVIWLLKPGNPIDIVREVVASKIYRSLVGDNAAAKVELLQINNEWFVASCWCNALTVYDCKSAGKEKMFAASAIINDRDCVSKNIGCLDQQIFRFDFGAGLTKVADDFENIEFATDILAAAGHPIFDNGVEIDITQLKEAIKEFKNPNINIDFWDTLIPDAKNEPLKPQYISALNRMEKLKKLALLPNDVKEQPILDAKDDLTKTLMTFYQSIADVKKPFNPNYVSLQVKSHLDALTKNGKHPEYFENYLKQAQDFLQKKRFADSIYKIISLPSRVTAHEKFHAVIQKNSDSIALVILRKIVNTTEALGFFSFNDADGVKQIKGILAANSADDKTLEEIAKILLSKKPLDDKPTLRKEKTHALYKKLYTFIPKRFSCVLENAHSNTKTNNK